MSEIVVGNLRYRGDPVAATMVDSLVSDALRTTLHDDGRLVLVRRMALGRFSLSRGDRLVAERTEAAWRDLIGRSCHGSSSSAASADCVWFHSSAEARTVLLRELAAGRPAFAWFWKLAVPEWRGQPMSVWLQERFEAALRQGDGAALLEVIEGSLAADCQTPASDALAAVLSTPGAPSPRSHPNLVGMGGAASSNADLLEALPNASAAISRIAQTIAPRLPDKIRLALSEAGRRSGGLHLLATLARALIRRSHPELLLDTAVADQAVASLIRVLVDQPAALQPRFEPSVTTHSAQSVNEPAPVSTSPASPTAAAATSPAAGTPASRDLAEPEPPMSAPSQSPLTPKVAFQSAEQASACAGLFLVVPVLIRLGWRDWLVRHPNLLPLRPGVGLLHHIALRHHVPPGDPLWDRFGELASEDLATIRPELELWRRGLDGWLRRSVRRRLHDLVLRPGWLSGDAERLVVRFGLSRIDLALRRRALDSDPGWVDWLGHSLRFEFRDNPLPGEHLP